MQHSAAKAYCASSAQAAFAVNELSATVAPSPIASASMADLYFIPEIIVLFILIIIVAVVMTVLIRKRP